MFSLKRAPNARTTGWLAAAVVGIGIMMLGARPVRAQVLYGCVAAYSFQPVFCSSFYPGCGSIVYTTVLYGNTGSYSFEGAPENECCGQPIFIYQPTGYCVLASPVHRTSKAKQARKILFASSRGPSRTPSALWRQRQPVYLMDCKGGYKLFIAAAR